MPLSIACKLHIHATWSFRSASSHQAALKRLEDPAQHKFQLATAPNIGENHKYGVRKAANLRPFGTYARSNEATSRGSHQPPVASSNLTARPRSRASRVAVVLFTGHGDLRIHDNPALVAASSAEQLYALFVFQPTGLSRNSNQRIRFLRSAIRDLQTSLLERYGVELMIHIGNSVEIVKQLCETVRATELHVHEAPVQDAVEELSTLQGSCSALVSVLCHSTPLRHKTTSTASSDYRDYRDRTRGIAFDLPSEDPVQLPPRGPLRADFECSALPSETELLALAARSRHSALHALHLQVGRSSGLAGANHQTGWLPRLRHLQALICPIVL
ncbi:1,3-beta-glucanosyltransferase [Cymbomonas tetramitiformis]|uniref:1,3-beta-glucanosyltransferase n=1 Tax=Cymbomonas tetramitiformis TaxID=36881 RepID=A0AAE0BBE3_9CHLO|nr:1,3-beta-glucanosyltransferase [Cymbomonas tetramitiformis]